LAASGVLDLPIGRRVLIFDPVLSADSGEVIAIIAGELDPGAILREATGRRPIRDEGSERLPDWYSLTGPNGVQITNQHLPAGWLTITQPVRVADTDWLLRFAYEPVDQGEFQATRLAIWITGTALGLALAGFLFGLQRLLDRQRTEIVRREA